jgi:hypothetical protein
MMSSLNCKTYDNVLDSYKLNIFNISHNRDKTDIKNQWISIKSNKFIIKTFVKGKGHIRKKQKTLLDERPMV